jgi:hypothetical protein
MIGAALLLLLVQPFNAMIIDLMPGESRCIGEEMEEDSFGKFSYGIIEPSAGADESMPHVRVTIADTTRWNLHAKNIVDYEPTSFALSTKNPGLHRMCFANRAWKHKEAAATRIHFEIKSDIETKDYSAVIRKEHLKPLQAELLIAEDTLKQVADEYKYMTKREARMRKTSESTAARINRFSYVSISLLVLLSVWQTLYLRSFFRSKKLM